ncbi:MAG: hypothetical protein A3G80_09185 [Betaproteobacteria bacterium RIFCSPLOWO2_12_FULL_62_13b]|nr:MAG: hypothetical protein A3G80_09185 [Betaproteobacteria bacterium RIFCSPLOWO2_12_FULL_62_13b]
MTGSRGTRACAEIGSSRRIPLAPVQGGIELPRGIKVELDHPVAGKLPTVASPMRFSATPLEYKLAPPVLGQHTEEILRGLLQKTEAEIARLKADGTV